MAFPLHAHVPCRQCGFDLHQQATDAVCPECGLPISESLKSDRLLHSSPRWLRRVALGWLLIGCGLVPWVIVMAWGMTRAAMGAISLGVVIVPMAIVVGAGLFLATLDEPGMRDESHRQHRLLARWAGLIAVTSASKTSVLMLLLRGVLTWPGSPPGGTPLDPNQYLVRFTFLMMGVTALASLIAWIGMTGWLLHLATRLPALSMTWSLRVMRWTWPAALTLTVVLLPLARSAARSGIDAWSVIGLLAALATTLLSLLGGLVVLRLPFHMHRALQRTRHDARHVNDSTMHDR